MGLVEVYGGCDAEYGDYITSNSDETYSGCDYYSDIEPECQEMRSSVSSTDSDSDSEEEEDDDDDDESSGMYVRNLAGLNDWYYACTIQNVTQNYEIKMVYLSDDGFTNNNYTGTWKPWRPNYWMWNGNGRMTLPYDIEIISTSGESVTVYDVITSQDEAERFALGVDFASSQDETEEPSVEPTRAPTSNSRGSGRYRSRLLLETQEEETTLISITNTIANNGKDSDYSDYYDFNFSVSSTSGASESIGKKENKWFSFDDDTKSVVIIGIIVGVCAGVCILVSGILICRKQRKDRVETRGKSSGRGSVDAGV